MTDWAAFAGFVGVVLGLLLILARASQATLQVGDESGAITSQADAAVSEERQQRRPLAGDTVRDPQDGAVAGGGLSEVPDGEGNRTVGEGRSDRTFDDGAGAGDPQLAELHWTERMHATQPALSTGGLLANVAISQGAFGLLLLAGAWIAAVPAAAFGVGPGTTDPAALGVGLGLGVALYAANEVGAAAGDRFGLERSEELRALLAPESPAEWAALLFVVLPVVAGFEELLFRGALVGALSMGFGVSPWLLAALSSVAFAVGHGAQGTTGIVVTGLLGFALATAFVLSGSLLVVVVAHYLVNALEFVVHEGLGVDWGGGEG